MEDRKFPHEETLDYRTRIIELEAAIRILLATWDNATAKMVSFSKDQNKETAEAYMATLTPMFDAGILMRSILNHK